MEKFFFGVGDGSSKKAIESFSPRQFDIMINYAAKVRSVPKNTRSLFVDSGGFSFFFKLKDFPDSHEKYLDFVRKVNADFFANKDYPCEPEVRKKWNRTVRENQEKTMDNEIEILELLEGDYHDLKNKFVAVVQGWTLDDYLWMIDEMKDRGLLTPILALGTMCRRGQDKTIRRYIIEIRENLPKKYKLHGFGIKFSVLKYPEVWKALWSADSMAYRYGIVRDWENGRTIEGQIREKLSKWIQNLEKFKINHVHQKTLLDFI